MKTAIRHPLALLAGVLLTTFAHAAEIPAGTVLNKANIDKLLTERNADAAKAGVVAIPLEKARAKVLEAYAKKK